jgi:hypothetical protein
MRYKIEGEFELKKDGKELSLAQRGVSYQISMQTYEIVDIGDCYLVIFVFIDSYLVARRSYARISKDLKLATEKCSSIHEAMSKEILLDANFRTGGACNAIRIMLNEPYTDKLKPEDTRKSTYFLVKGTNSETFLCRFRSHMI